MIWTDAEVNKLREFSKHHSHAVVANKLNTLFDNERTSAGVAQKCQRMGFEKPAYPLISKRAGRPVCPTCLSGDFKYLKEGTEIECRGCLSRFPVPEGFFDNVGRKPKVLVLDIETAPMHVRVWGMFKQRISPKQVIHDWYIICWSGKWLNEPEIFGDCVTPEETRRRYDPDETREVDDRVTQSVWEMINEADAVIAHNGDRFDLRKIRARWIVRNQDLPSPWVSIDTLKITQREFGFSSHKQEYITKFLKLSEKLDTEYQMWIDCEGGNQKALDKMFKYCRGDVVGLEDMFLRIRKYAHSLPNMALFTDLSDGQACGNCTSTDLDWSGEYDYTTPSNRYSAFQCNSCGSWGKSRYSNLRPSQRQNLMGKIAR